MAIVGNITNPILQQISDPVHKTIAAATTDMAQGARDISNSSRVTPTKQVGPIQETSRKPRTTPEDVAKQVTQESNTARVTPKEDQVTISENAKIARSPQPVQVGDTVGNLNVGNKLSIKA